MRSVALAIAVLACGKGGGSAPQPSATPEQAAAVASQFAAALAKCDQAAIAPVYDPKAIAREAIGKDDARFLDLAAKETIECSARKLTVIVVDAKRPKPLLRWRRGTAELREYGYLELTIAGAPPRVMDLATPLHPMSVATGLHNIYTNGLPEGDQPGMISDIFGTPFTGLPSGAHFASQFDNPAHTSDIEIDPANFDLVIERAFMAKDYVAAAIAADKLGKLVGNDIEIATLQIAAAIGAGHTDAALQQAKDVTTKWPDEEDGWQIRLAAEMAGGSKAGIDECKTALAKFATR